MKKREREFKKTHALVTRFVYIFLSKEKTYFQAKRLAVIQTEYLTDKIIIKVRKKGIFILSSKFPGICCCLFLFENKYWNYSRHLSIIISSTGADVLYGENGIPERGLLRLAK